MNTGFKVLLQKARINETTITILQDEDITDEAILISLSRDDLKILLSRSSLLTIGQYSMLVSLWEKLRDRGSRVLRRLILQVKSTMPPLVTPILI